MPVVSIVAGVFTAGAGFAALAGAEAFSFHALGQVAIGLGAIGQGARSLAPPGDDFGGGGSPAFTLPSVQLAQASAGAGVFVSDAGAGFRFGAGSDEPGLESPLFDPIDLFVLGAGIIKLTKGLGQTAAKAIIPRIPRTGLTSIDDLVAGSRVISRSSRVIQLERPGGFSEARSLSE